MTRIAHLILSLSLFGLTAVGVLGLGSCHDGRRARSSPIADCELYLRWASHFSDAPKPSNAELRQHLDAVTRCLQLEQQGELGPPPGRTVNSERAERFQFVKLTIETWLQDSEREAVLDDNNCTANPLAPACGI
jgi:hypothetical protein